MRRAAASLRTLAWTVAGLAAAVSAVPAGAEPERAVVVAAAGPSWSSLTPAQQDALAPLRRDWAEIDPARRQMWLQIADLFPNLPPDERNRVQARMEDWARLSPAERLQARLNFRETRRISAEQRAALWDAYLALPPEQRQALAQRARTVPPVASAAPQRKVSNAAGRPAVPAAAAAPVTVQARPGASTTLVTAAPAPAPEPVPRAAGTAPIVIPPNLIDRTTLLPQPPPRKPKATRAPATASAPVAGAASAAGPGPTASVPAMAAAVAAPGAAPPPAADAGR